MVIKNLTSVKQKVVVKELVGEKNSYDLFLEPEGTTELDHHLTIDATAYAGIIAIEGGTPVAVEVKAEPVVEKAAEPEPVVEEKIEEPVVEKKEEPVVEKKSDAFVCDICGAEFASARGLASHKNKAHAE